jgi:carboxyl-terminal processing protease
MKQELSRSCFVVTILSCLSLCQPGYAQQQPQPKISKDEKQDVMYMLDTISKDVKKHYYDPKLHDLDWEANIKKYRERIDGASSLNKGLSEVAAALDALNDSHTFFIPPPRPYKHDYGWQIGMVGEKCLVLAVRPQSDAAGKGVQPGDQVLTINGFLPQRDNLWKMNYVFKSLRPQQVLNVSLISPEGQKKNIELVAAMRQLPKVRDLTGGRIFDYIRDIQDEVDLTKARYTELEADILVFKLPEFAQTEMSVDSMMKKTHHKKALIIDLRGNPGGAVTTLIEIVRNLFDHDVKIRDRVTRDDSKPQNAKTIGKSAFAGKLLVLVDSRSASASEVLARIVQIEKRGVVIGDRTAGAVMEARHYPYQIGLGVIIPYGASITDADLIMTDGKSLEKVGVSPDETLIPSPADLAAGRDTVLAHAVELAGGKITPEAAGKLFPVLWPSD